MMISYKYPKPLIPFLSFFMALLNLFVFSKDRFVARSALLSLKPQTKTVCHIDSCQICQEVCPVKIVTKDSQTVMITSVACLECELCMERCPHTLIKKK